MLIHRLNICLSTLHAYLLKSTLQANEVGIFMTPPYTERYWDFQSFLTKIRKPSPWVGGYLNVCPGAPRAVLWTACEVCGLLPPWFCLLELISIQVLLPIYLRYTSLPRTLESVYIFCQLSMIDLSDIANGNIKRYSHSGKQFSSFLKN